MPRAAIVVGLFLGGLAVGTIIVVAGVAIGGPASMDDPPASGIGADGGDGDDGTLTAIVIIGLTALASKLIVDFVRRRRISGPRPTDPAVRQVNYVNWSRAPANSASARKRQIPYELSLASIIVGMVVPVAGVILSIAASG
jgi:hypothetical protein